MSRAIASARQRRAGISNPDPVQQQQQQQPSTAAASGLTLPQVIALVDSRLIKLETFVKEQKEQNQNPLFQKSSQAQAPQNQGLQSSAFAEEVLEEYNHRFTILADEIATLKDIVLKLQSFTMDVNKTLLENQAIIHSHPVAEDKSLFTMHSIYDTSTSSPAISNIELDITEESIHE